MNTGLTGFFHDPTHVAAQNLTDGGSVARDW